MFQFSLHSLEQLAKRNIAEETVLLIIDNATGKLLIDGISVYQSIIEENEKRYLIRVFVNEDKMPPVIITAYKTSKLDKY
jgi:hypothetical protein